MADVFAQSSNPIEPVTQIGRLSQFCNPKPPPSVRINPLKDAEIPVGTIQIRMSQVMFVTPTPDFDDFQGSDMIVVNNTTRTIQHQVPIPQLVPNLLRVVTHSPLPLGTMSVVGTSPTAFDIEIDPYGHILLCLDTPIESSEYSSGGSSGESSDHSSGEDPPETCEEAVDGIPCCTPVLAPVYWINDDLSHDVGWYFDGSMFRTNPGSYSTGTFECSINELGQVEWLYRITWYAGHGVHVSLAGVLVGWPVGNTFEIFSTSWPFGSSGHKTLMLGPG